MKYAFLIGRNEALSRGELEVFFDPAKIIKNDDGLLLVEGELPSEAQKFLNRLGGTIKIIEQIAETEKASLVAEISQYLETHFSSEKKNIFSVNFYGSAENAALKKLLPAIKNKLKENFKLRFLNKNFTNASHVAVWEERLVETQTDINVVPLGGKFWMGKTVAIQDIGAYGQRDYGKPFRDAVNGMLPPKLAQIMINLSKPASGAVIYDPFCGTGTVPMEALLMGFSALGSDISEKMVEGSQKNLEWLKKEFSLSSQDFPVTHQDAATISAFPAGQHICMVTEPFLGPPLSEYPPSPLFEKIQGELLRLYSAFFKNLAAHLPKGSTIIIAFPCFRKSPREFTKLPGLIELIEKFGFKNLPLTSSRQTIIYERPDQIVAREITKLVY